MQSALKATGVSIADIGYFDNMLHDDASASASRSTTS